MKIHAFLPQNIWDCSFVAEPSPRTLQNCLYQRSFVTQLCVCQIVAVVERDTKGRARGIMAARGAHATD